MYYIITKNNLIPNQIYNKTGYFVKSLSKLKNESFTKICVVKVLNDKIKILYNMFNIVIDAIRYEHIEVLNWLKIVNYNFKNVKYFIDYSISLGSIKILNWFLQSGFIIRYSFNIINIACLNGHLKVLKWLKLHNFNFKYNPVNILNAYENKHYKIIYWFNLKYCCKKILLYIYKNYFNFDYGDDYDFVKYNILINFSKTLQFKKKNKYIKGYNKN